MDDESIKAVYDYKSSPEGQITQAALMLRKALKDVQSKPLKAPLSVETLAKGEGDPPELVKLFFSILLGGPGYNHHSPSIRRRADSMSQDALFVVKGGKLRTANHILTSMSLKSLTGSRKIITIMNKLGHCLNYNKVEELETE